MNDTFFFVIKKVKQTPTEKKKKITPELKDTIDGERKDEQNKNKKRN